jgi:rare lipoprotein A
MGGIVKHTAAILVIFTALFSPACSTKEKVKKPVGVVEPGAGALKSVKPYTIAGVMYYPLADAYGYEETGVASWYGKDFHGKPTASGEIYDMNGVTAAHKTLPLGTMVEVTRLDNGSKVVTRVNDRGPFVADRIIDLSYGTARKLDIVGAGKARVRVVALAEGKPGDGGAPVPSKPLPDFAHGVFYVQTGAFAETANAQRVQESLTTSNHKVRLQPHTAPDGTQLTRVQVGPFGDMDSAKATLATLRDKGYAGSFIVAD